MTWQISFPCGALYLHFIRCCSWLYALNLVDFVNDMAWKISFPCGALYLVSTLFALPCWLLNSLGTTEHIPIICPFVKATFFISCRDRTFFCNKDNIQREGSFLSHDHCGHPNRSLLRALSTVCHEKPFSLPTLRCNPQKVELWSLDHVLQMLAALLWQRQSPIKLIWNGSS